MFCLFSLLNLGLCEVPHSFWPNLFLWSGHQRVEPAPHPSPAKPRPLPVSSGVSRATRPAGVPPGPPQSSRSAQWLQWWRWQGPRLSRHICLHATGPTAAFTAGLILPTTMSSFPRYVHDLTHRCWADASSPGSGRVRSLAPQVSCRGSAWP